MNVLTSSLLELRQALREGMITSEKIAEDYLAQIKKWDKEVNSYITVCGDVVERARELDKKRPSQKEFDEKPLLGLPVAIKDLLCTEGVRTTAASKMLENFVPPYSSTVTRRLFENAGGLMLGKVNLDEFAMGSSCENSRFGCTRNPWNFEHVPGGSSGGSAASVAAGMAPASIGTDTGGSIRQPAHFCGVVGVKPTYGRVSRFGIIAFASSLDQAGPMTRTVKDAALMSQVISGLDVNDATTAAVDVPDWLGSLSTDLRGKKIGILKEFMPSGLQEETSAAVASARRMLEEAGAEFVEVSVPLTDMSVPAYYMVATSEASSNLARYDGVRYGYRADFGEHPSKDLVDFYSRTRGEGFGSEVKRRLMLGTYALSSGYYDAYYRKAGQIRRMMRDQFIEAFKRCDAILSPVAATPAFRIGERVSDPLQMYLNDIFTTSANLVGIPGLSVPICLSKEGLPIGVQLMATHFNEQILFDAGEAIETRARFRENLPHVLQ